MRAAGLPAGTALEGGIPLSPGWKLRAAAASLVVPPLLELVSFARIERALRALARLRPSAPLDDVAAARFVDRFMQRLPGPWGWTCLRRAAVIYNLLRSAGRNAELCIGVRREPDGSLHAHAWLLRDGELYLEPGRLPERVADFTVIARFPSAAAAHTR